MTLDTILLILGGAAGWGILSKLLDDRAQFKRRIVDEVAPLLRRPDEEQLRELLDLQGDRPSPSSSFVSSGDRPDRREQRARLDALQEQYSRLSHNSRIVFQWADTEWYDVIHYRLQESYGPELCAKSKEARLAALEFRWAIRVALARIWLLGLLNFDALRFVPVPSIAALARTGSIDILKTYELVKRAALALAAVYGDSNEYADAIAALM